MLKENCIIDEKGIAYINGVYDEARRVQDAWRYNILFKNNEIVEFCKFYQGIGRFYDQEIHSKKNRSIVIIIESPHKDEYTENFVPISPAQGATGEKIEKFIVDILRKHKQIELPNGLYNLLIVNPVQFQASLFNFHKVPLNSKHSAASALRDKVWRSIFLKEKDNFTKRLVSYRPALLINACTAKLKSLIDEEIEHLIENRIITDIGYFIANKHPSMWSSKTILTKAKNTNPSDAKKPHR